MDKKVIYSECIAISGDAVSIRAEVYSGKEYLGKANVIINLNDGRYSIVTVDHGANFDSTILNKIGEHCIDRVKHVWRIKE